MSHSDDVTAFPYKVSPHTDVDGSVLLAVPWLENLNRMHWLWKLLLLLGQMLLIELHLIECSRDRKYVLTGYSVCWAPSLL